MNRKQLPIERSSPSIWWFLSALPQTNDKRENVCIRYLPVLIIVVVTRQISAHEIVAMSFIAAINTRALADTEAKSKERDDNERN